MLCLCVCVCARVYVYVCVCVCVCRPHEWIRSDHVHNQHHYLHTHLFVHLSCTIQFIVQSSYFMRFEQKGGDAVCMYEDEQHCNWVK
jgi:hypothetical protein